MAKQLKITLKKGLVGSTQVQKDNVHSLGLRKIHQTVLREDTPVYRGMIQKVRHLVVVEELD